MVKRKWAALLLERGEAEGHVFTFFVVFSVVFFVVSFWIGLVLSDVYINSNRCSCLFEFVF